MIPPPPQTSCVLQDPYMARQWQISVQNNQLITAPVGYSPYLYTQTSILPMKVQFTLDESYMSIEYMNWQGLILHRKFQLFGSYQKYGNRHTSVLPGTNNQAFSYRVENQSDGTRIVKRFIGTVRTEALNCR